jgi:uncharacterized protein with GYD domain
VSIHRARYVVLVNFTEKGIANVEDSRRGRGVSKSVAKSGGTVPAMYGRWPVDGVVGARGPTMPPLRLWF